MNHDLSSGSSEHLLRQEQLSAAECQHGFTLMETMVALGMSAVVMYAITSLYLLVSSTTYDQKIQAATNLQVQALMQTIGSDVRSMGNGVPFDQPRFGIGEEGLLDDSVTDPINITLTDENKLVFRLNETGDVQLLTAAFDPLTSTTIFLTSVTSFRVGDSIYLNDSVVSGEDGLYGVIESIDTGANSITLKSSSIVYKPEVIFAIGTVIEPVPEVTYTSDLTTETVYRNSGSDDVVMAENTTVTFSYLDQNGAELTLPLTRVAVIDSLRSIRVTIQAEGEKKLSSGEDYTAVAQQTFALRNLNFNF